MRYHSYSEYQGRVKQELTTLSYGPTGPTGSQGEQGPTGKNGNFGGATFKYIFDISNNISFPSKNHLKLNNISFTCVSEIGFYSFDTSNVYIDSFMTTITSVDGIIKGYLRLSKITDANIYSLFSIIDTSFYNNWWQLSVEYLSSSSPLQFNDADNINASFIVAGNQGVIGPEGKKGSEGQRGPIGPIGPKGEQGLRGTEGPRGPTGSQGLQGIKGNTGNDGKNGKNGNFGGATFKYIFNILNNICLPNQYHLKLNNLSFTCVSEIGFYSFDANNVSINPFMTTITSVDGIHKGYIRLSKITDSNIYSLFSIINTSFNNNWWRLSVEYLSSSSPLQFSDNDNINASFIVAGNQGSIGPEGPIGKEGPEGPVGPKGLQGIQGDNGNDALTYAPSGISFFTDLNDIWGNCLNPMVKSFKLNNLASTNISSPVIDFIGWPILPGNSGLYYNIYGKCIETPLPTDIITYSVSIPNYNNGNATNGAIFSVSLTYISKQTDNIEYDIYIANYDTSEQRQLERTSSLGVTGTQPGTKNNLSWTETSRLTNNSGFIPLRGGDKIGIYVKQPSNLIDISPPKLLIDATVFIYLITTS